MRKLLLLLFPLVVRAEFLDVRLRVDRLECDTCRKNLEIGLQKVRGVLKIAVSSGEGASFSLAKGNRITLDQLREAVRAVGFNPTSAIVVVLGRPRTEDGRWRFTVEGTGQVYNLSSGYDPILLSLRAKNGELITVRAESPAPPDRKTTPSLDVLAIQ